MKFISIGDNVTDCYINRNTYYPGGNAVNVAVNVKRNGAERVEYIGVFATDDKAEHIKKSLLKENIIINRCRTAEGISGQPHVEIHDDGDRIFISNNRETVQHKLAVRLSKSELESLSEYDLLHTSCYSYMEDYLSVLSKHIKVSYDFSDEGDLTEELKLCKFIDYAFISGSNIPENNLKTIMKKAVENGSTLSCVTLGEKGSICFDGQKYHECGARKVQALDAMGAGDSFIGAFLYYYSTHKQIQEAMEYASQKAAETCLQEGAFGYPQKAEF